GHTRLIPNDAISVLPLRFVTRGGAVFLTKTSAPLARLAPGKLIAVNGIAVEKIEEARASLLAGTRQRKRVIGPILFSWPAALAHLDCASIADGTLYQLEDADGCRTEVKVANSDTVPASEMYPRNEHGQLGPVWNFKGFVDVRECSETGLVIQLPSFFDPGESDFSKVIDSAANRVQSHPDRFLLIDVRGNTGGDFLKTMPLIDAITDTARLRGCAVLGDKFTFSAAIVFVAILKYRLGRKLTIVGEDMGDGLKFYAEGGLIELPTSGAAVRYSTAFHDWETGTADPTTPPEIARQLVSVRRLEVDRSWCATPFDTTPEEIVYQRLVADLA
ncbi:MAG: peptidase S41, partial [Pseudomonadota bacterium]